MLHILICSKIFYVLNIKKKLTIKQANNDNLRWLEMKMDLLVEISAFMININVTFPSGNVTHPEDTM